ncbi:MAG: ComF family protein [Phycisphaerales bacterium]|nr:ComF family protein [Phycisphaerales bacterium]
MIPPVKNADAEKFTWPPQSDTPPSSATHTSVPIRLPNPLIESIETHLLGRTGLAFDRWALQTGWTRDQNKDYCWRCGGSIGEFESDGDGCATCRDKKLPWDRAIRLGSYQGTLRQEVLALKFKSWRPTGYGLGKHLGWAIKEQLEIAQVPPDQAALVPIPMHRFRRISRGVDHTLVLARSAAKSSGCSIMPILSTKLRSEQVGLSKTARARNMKDAFFISNKAQRKLRSSTTQKHRVYILIDDVRTTGATFVAASKVVDSAFKAIEGGNSDGQSTIEVWTACIGVAGKSRRKAEDAQA